MAQALTRTKGDVQSHFLPPRVGLVQQVQYIERDGIKLRHSGDSKSSDDARSRPVVRVTGRTTHQECIQSAPEMYKAEKDWTTHACPHSSVFTSHSNRLVVSFGLWLISKWFAH